MRHFFTTIIFLFLLINHLNAQGTFLKTIGGIGDDVAFDALQSSDGNILLAGYTTSFGNGGQDGYILKITPQGQQLWSKTIGGAGDELIRKIVQLPNKDIVLFGVTASFGSGNTDIFITRLDNNGNTIWTKTFGGSNDEHFHDAMLTSTGELVAVGYTETYGAGQRDIFLLKLSTNGNLIWSKTLGNTSNDWASGIMENNLGHYVLAATWSYNVGLPMHNGATIIVNTNGSIFTTIYGSSQNEGFNNYIEMGSNAAIVTGSSWSWNANNEIWISEINSAGTVNWSKTYRITNENIRPTRYVKLSNNDIVIGGYEFTNNGTDKGLLMKVSSSGNLQWAKSYGNSSTDRITDVLALNGGYFLVGDSDANGQGGKDILIIQTDANGDVSGCSMPVNMVQSSVTPMSSVVTTITSTPNTNIGIFTHPNANSFASNTVCAELPPVADFFRSDSILCLNDCISLTDNSTGADQWNWTITGANITTDTNTNVSNVCFQSLGTQTITLIVTNPFGADTISKTVTVFPYPSVDLGTDTTLCIQTLTLDATYPNVTYLWSDSSTSPTLDVNASGLYWVELNNGNCIVRDSIQVNFMPYPSVDLGPDTSTCVNLPLTLDATQPNASYLWSDNSSTSTLLASNAGIYWVDVTVGLCTTRDSIEILDVFELPEVDLGDDMILCPDEVITLDAFHPNATSYLWQDGSSNSSNTVQQVGIYIVEVSNLCISVFDTIEFTSLELSLNLEDTIVTCLNQTYELDAFHPNATSYLWQDNSTQSNYLAIQSGVYFVEISNECETLTDSVLIISSEPHLGFSLGDDYQLCEGDSLYLDMTTTNAIWYQWQDSLTSPTRVISELGLYTITISNGCLERTDEILIHNEGCCELFVPNAFTPNYDGENDVFKVYLPSKNCQDVFDFSMKIFDRWGELVFETNDIENGWDGNFYNQKMPNAVYVWMIEYSNGEEKVVRKGSVTLVR